MVRLVGATVKEGHRMTTIAEEMKRVFGDQAKVVHIDMLYEDEIQAYVMAIEEAHEKAANSELSFP